MNARKKRQKEQRRARKLVEEAWDAEEDGHHERAVRIIRRAIGANPANPVLWNDLGLLLRHNDDVEAAQAFLAAISLTPDMAEAYANLAEIRTQQGLLQEAVTLQANAVRLASGIRQYAERLETWRALAGRTACDDLPRKSEPSTSISQCPIEQSLRATFASLADHIDMLDWESAERQLTQHGFTHIQEFLSAEECQLLITMFDDDSLFRKSVVMDKEQFGRGVYRYFDAPIPRLIDAVRRIVYPRVARIANRWQRLLSQDSLFPTTWEAYRIRCEAAGQTTPTPILLKYEVGGFNALHRDIRGAEFFPIQLVIVLSPREDFTTKRLMRRDAQSVHGTESPEQRSEQTRAACAEISGFTGGEFLFCDEPERKKKDRRRISAGLGDAILFCTRARLVQVGGAYGLKPVKHGMDRINSGHRFSVGIPFHEYE